MAQPISESDHDYSHLFKPGAEEKKFAQIANVCEKTLLANPVVQIKIKARVLGANMVEKLLTRGQRLPMREILTYLSWLDLALVLVWLGPMFQITLAHLAVEHAKQIFVANTDKHLAEHGMFIQISNY